LRPYCSRHFFFFFPLGQAPSIAVTTSLSPLTLDCLRHIVLFTTCSFFIFSCVLRRELLRYPGLTGELFVTFHLYRFNSPPLSPLPLCLFFQRVPSPRRSGQTRFGALFFFFFSILTEGSFFSIYNLRQVIEIMWAAYCLPSCPLGDSACLCFKTVFRKLVSLGLL